MKKIIVLAALITAGCADKVSFNTVEDARKQVRENVTMIAQKHRSENKLADYDIYVRGDSTQQANCPQGDGWASVDLINRTNSQTIKMKCSTVSIGIGCISAEDFKNKRFAQEEDRCNSDIPFPLPKIVQ